MSRAASLPLLSLIKNTCSRRRPLPTFTTTQSYPTMFFSTEDLGPNPGLASVIAQGMQSLQATAADVQAKTQHKSLDKVQNQNGARPNPRQQAESQRILDMAIECLEDELMKGKSRAAQLLSMNGEPIVLLDVDVNKDLKQAKVYWALPYTVLLDDQVNRRIYHHLLLKMNENIIEKGGAKWLGQQVHARLRSYYPPRLKLLPASDEMVQRALQEYWGD